MYVNVAGHLAVAGLKKFSQTPTQCIDNIQSNSRCH